MFFCVIIKNLNWENLTKNSVTFKKWDRVKDQKFYFIIIFFFGGGWVHWNIWFLREFPKKQYIGENSLKSGNLDIFQIIGGDHEIE